MHQDVSTQREPIVDSTLEVHGDFRLRYEHTSEHAGLRDRSRGVLRGRLGATWGVSDTTILGARIDTGDPDDPNSVDVSLGNFFDNLDVSLDQLYAAYTGKNLFATGGKFPNPLARTDLVWDSDVNPYGAAGRYQFLDSDRLAVAVTGIYALVDEQTEFDDSTMTGGQLSFRYRGRGPWSAGFDAAYYDYEIGSLVNTDAGDIRGNNLTPGGTAYLSDFDLLNLIATARFAGFGERWTIDVIADYVRNLGANVPEDTGYGIDLFVGDTAAIGNVQFRYGYAVAETDAVLAAFSHDNTTYPTNYRQHTLEVAYRAMDKTWLYLTTYRYRRENFGLLEQPGDDDWVSRIRLNLHYQF